MRGERGYTLVELLVTVLIVTVVATVLGTSFVRLLTLREKDRELAYVRETLSAICGVCADYLSVASSYSTNALGIVAEYPHETGGVSLETGRVDHVARFVAEANRQRSGLELGVLSYAQGELRTAYARGVRGDAELIPQAARLTDCSLTPLGAVQIEDAALARLRLTAVCQYEDERGKSVQKTVTSERLVRLWNHE